ncbi:MAG: hypothetical protein ABIK47_00130 [candidate division WOR-3 bacterium]
MRKGRLLVAGVLAVLLLPAGVSAKSLMAINFQTGLTQSAGYTFAGIRSVFSGIVGVSYDRALVTSRYNKGVFGLLVGYQPEGSTFFVFLGGNFAVGMKSGVYDPVQRGSVPLFIDFGGKMRIAGSEQVRLCLSGELKYHFDPGMMFVPTGLSPGLGLLVELGRL